MKHAIDIIESDTTVSEQTYGLDSNKMVEGSAAATEPPKKRGPGRPPKNANTLAPTNTYTDVVAADKQNASNKASAYEKKVEEKYRAQVGLIAGIIQQTDSMYSTIEGQLQQYRDRPSYGGKSRMMTMAELQNTQVSLINTKLAAVRELNNVASKITDTVFKHEQAMKMDGDDNGDREVMKMYQMMLDSQKYGLPPMMAPLHPTSINTGVGLNGAPINGVNIGIPVESSGIVPASHSGSAASLSSPGLNQTQKRMLLEQNPNIKTVVVYNQSTGSKRFDIVDVTTGVSVPGVERPADFLLEDIKPDFRNGIASNTNTNMVFPLVIEGTRAIDEL